MDEPRRRGHNGTTREWLVTNGLGGSASGTVKGAHTRSYHSLLTAALHAPIGRMIMWSHLFEQLTFADGTCVSLTESAALAGFRLENGLPIWSFLVRHTEIERRIFLPYLQNTVVITYRIISGIPWR